MFEIDFNIDKFKVLFVYDAVSFTDGASTNCINHLTIINIDHLSIIKKSLLNAYIFDDLKIDIYKKVDFILACK